LEGNLLKISLENKTLKKDKAELEKENGSLRASLKSSRRDFQHDVHEFEKKNKTLEDLIENLKEFKSVKLAEEKDLRSNSKKVDRKLKLIEEKEAKLKVDLKRKEKIFNNDEIKNEIEPKETKENGETINEIKFSKLLPPCSHPPQCTSRAPYPPPHGPPTFTQFEHQDELEARDALERDAIAEKSGDIIVDVVTNNRFETLVDINDNNENQAQHHPELRLECKSSDQKNTMYGASGFTSTPSTSSSSAVTSSSNTSFQERIQCDHCSRKCVDERDMEHHIFLWHTDRETQILMSIKKHTTSNF
jgi:DNA repair exonuclease SbcCD ATPase subunit